MQGQSQELRLSGGRDAMVLGYQVMNLYESTLRRGWLHRTWLALGGRPAQLLNLADVAARRTVSARHYLGLQIVPIRQIRGSEGRCRDFDDLFHPLRQHAEARWNGIARAWLRGANLPPVDLICIEGIYFVRDGHHRISVARALGQQMIEAEVTIWQVDQ